MRDTCKERCIMEDTCVSINIGPPIKVKVFCELSGSDNLKPRAGFTYRGTENPCFSKPCLNDGICLNGFTNQKYDCVCKASYTGEICEIDIDECTAGRHDCHVHANCTNTVGSFNFIFKTGTAGDGYNCSLLPAKSCRELYDRGLSEGNKACSLKLGSFVLPVYCHMTDVLGECGGGGWTLVMKMNGSQRTFHYSSSLWSDKETFNLAGGETGFDTHETKLPRCWNAPFTKKCLGMKIGQQINFVVITKQAESLHSLIADGQYRATSLGRAPWKTLIDSQASLQANCNKEGFNSIGPFESIQSKARIGIVSNNQNNCFSSDSRIGFGTGGLHDDNNTCGNEAVLSADNGDKHIKASGYILLQ